jgi:protein SCO1/2
MPGTHLRRAVRPTRIFAILVVVLLIGSVAAHHLAVRRLAGATRVQGQVPDFSLTDQAGHPVTRASLAGSVWVADFIFTRCAGQCPLLSSQMAELQSAFARVPGVQLVSFTVDPEHDTPPMLAAYAAHYGAAPGRWRFLTGSREAVWRLSREGFRLGVGDGGTAQEPITHSVRLVLVDQAGRIRGSYDATDAEALRRLRGDIRRLLAARPQVSVAGVGHSTPHASGTGTQGAER